MAFTAKELPYARIKQFQYFADNGGTNSGTYTEDFAPSFAFEVEKIRLRLSTVHASVVDFMVTLSHHLGSVYNANLLSQAMNGVQDVLLQFNPTLKMFEGDAVKFSLFISAVNNYGLEISGWSITVPARA